MRQSLYATFFQTISTRTNRHHQHIHTLCQRVTQSSISKYRYQTISTFRMTSPKYGSTLSTSAPMNIPKPSGSGGGAGGLEVDRPEMGSGRASELKSFCTTGRYLCSSDHVLIPPYLSERSWLWVEPPRSALCLINILL